MKIFTQILTLLLCMISIDSIPGVKDIALDFCKEMPSVVIDSMVRTPSGSIYVFFGRMFSIIESITPNGLPVIHEDYPQITETFWGQLDYDIRVAFAYNKNIYFFIPGKFWRHNPFSNSKNDLTEIDGVKEFLFLQKIADIKNSLFSVNTEPNLDNELKTIFLVNYFVTEDSDKFIIRGITEGNTTINSSNKSKMDLDMSYFLIESLVIDYWQRGKQTILSSLRTISKMYYNFLHIQGFDRALTAQKKFRPNVRFRTVGYNQVFFGCPQPMCLDSTLDTIMSEDDLKTLLVFRGRFFWTVQSVSPPLSSKARLISQEFKGLPNYLDASYYVSGQKIFFKNDLYYTLINGIWIGESIFDKFPEIETPIDAIFHIKKTDETFIFKDKKYWIFIDTKLKSIGKISDFSELPNHIDAALSTDHRIIIFKNWYYYEIDIKDYKGELHKKSVSKPMQTFTTILNCPQDIYSKPDEGYKDLNSYLTKYEFETKPISAKNDRKITNNRPLIKTTTDEISKANNGSKESVNWLLYLISALILFLILIILILYVVNDSHKERNGKKPKPKVLVQNRYKAELKEKNNNKQSLKPVDKQTNNKINLQKVSKPKTPNESIVHFKREDSGEDFEPIDRTDSSEKTLKRVSTEFFTPSPNPTLVPEHKVQLNDLFVNVNDNKSK